MNLHRLIIILMLAVGTTSFAREWTEHYELPEVELDSALRSFISDSIVPVRKYDYFQIGVIYLRDKIIEMRAGYSRNFTDDVEIEISFNSEISDGPFEGYTVIDNIIFLIVESDNAKNLDKTDEPLLPVFRKRDDTPPDKIPILVDWGETFWIKHNSNGYQLKK